MRPARRRAHGEIREEGSEIRLASAFLIAILVLAGCGSAQDTKKSSGGNDKTAKSDQTAEDQVVNTQAGTATGISQETKRLPVWKVKWQSARIIQTPDGNTITEMKQSSGTFMQQGKDASTFQSQTGTADKSSGDIDVNGQVVVVSLTHKATMHCDHVHYLSKGNQIVQATGNVRVDGEWGNVSGLQEVWATPDLKVFGTPDLFKQK